MKGARIPVSLNTNHRFPPHRMRLMKPNACRGGEEERGGERREERVEEGRGEGRRREENHGDV